MTPTQIETTARQMYNAVGSSFFAPDEILTYIYMAEMDLARRALVIQNVLSTTTVALTRDYALSPNTMMVKKVTWKGTKLTKIDFSEDDLVTGFVEDTTSSGDPRYYSIWEKTLILRPIPASAETLKIWTYDIPSIPAITSTLDVDTRYHPDIIFYVLAQMVTKDEKYNLADRYMQQWETCIARAIKDAAKERRADSFAHVKDEENLANFTFRGV